MSNQRFKIPRTSDKKVAETFRNLGEKFEVHQANVSALAFSHLGQVALTEDPTGDWKSLLDHDSFLIESISCKIENLNISYYRGGNYASNEKSPIYDEIVLAESGTGSLSNTEKLNIVAFLNEKLHPFEDGRIAGSGVTKEQSQLLAIHQSTLERLEGLNEDLIRQSSDFRRRLEDQLQEKVKAIEEEYAQKKKILEENIESLAENVKKRELDVDKKLKEIDDRDNTHVRRETRDRMLDDVKKRIQQFGVSIATERKRQPVAIGMAVLFFVFIGLLIWTGYEIVTMNKEYLYALESIRNISGWGVDKFKALGISPDIVAKVSATDVDRTHIYWLWARFTLFSFGLVGTIIYYIKWQNRWAEQHIVSEFQLQQFYIDVNRANWVIESCLEWRKETKSAIPKELLGSIASGLFVNNQTEPEHVIHPADELASALLGTASKLKLKVGDSELEFDKPSKIPNKPIKTGGSNES